MDCERTIERVLEVIRKKETSCFYLKDSWVESFDAPTNVPRLMLTNDDDKWNYVSYDGEGEHTQTFSKIDASKAASYTTNFVKDFLE
jgi:hypothetical protein